MFANERRMKIIELLTAATSVTVSELINMFQVSIETIRRDLEYLEQQGALKRVHGGAVSIKKMQNYTKLSERVFDHQREKQELTAAGAGYIRNGDVIAMDGGSTTPLLASYVKEVFSKLTIITNSIDIFHLLSEKEGFKVILTGGYYHQNEHAFYGHMTLDLISQLHAAKYFLAPSALSLKFGISDFIQEMIPVQRAFLESCDQVIVLADSSMFETEAALKICRLNPAYVYVTDSALSDEIKETYHDHGIIVNRRV